PGRKAGWREVCYGFSRKSFQKRRGTMKKLVRFTMTVLFFMLAGGMWLMADDSLLKPQLLGTWLVEGSFGDGSAPFHVLITFMPGRSVNEGTLIDTNEFQLTGNPICTPDQGVWKWVSGGKFIATHLTFCFDV